MTRSVTSQNTELSSWITLYNYYGQPQHEQGVTKREIFFYVIIYQLTATWVINDLFICTLFCTVRVFLV
jgi:hypothetical protein